MKIIEMYCVLYNFSSKIWELDFYVHGVATVTYSMNRENNKTMWTQTTHANVATLLPFLLECPLSGKLRISEEEYFQLSCNWEHKIDMDLLASIQKYCYTCWDNGFKEHLAADEQRVKITLEY